jgi:hypothetical protein
MVGRVAGWAPVVTGAGVIQRDICGRPTPAGVARHLGLANTTFRRRFPHIVAELAAPTSDRQPSSSRPARTSYDQLNDDNARLREHKRELAEHLEFAVAQLQRLTLDNHQLREQLETERQITRLPRSSANLRHTKGSTHS